MYKLCQFAWGYQLPYFHDQMLQLLILNYNKTMPLYLLNNLLCCAKVIVWQSYYYRYRFTNCKYELKFIVLANTQASSSVIALTGEAHILLHLHQSYGSLHCSDWDSPSYEEGSSV